MFKYRSAIVLSLVFLLAPTLSQANDKKVLWDISSIPMTTDFIQVEDWLITEMRQPIDDWDYQWLTIDRAQVLNLAENDAIEVMSPTGRHVFSIREIGITESGIRTIVGHKAKDSNEFLLMTVSSNRFYGTLVSKGGTYSIRGLDGSAIIFAEHLPQGLSSPSNERTPFMSTQAYSANLSDHNEAPYPLVLGIYYNSEFDFADVEPRVLHMASLADEAFSQSDTDLYISDVIFEPVDGNYNYFPTALSHLRFPSGNTYDGLGIVPEHRGVHGVDFAFYVGERDLEGKCSDVIDKLGKNLGHEKFVAAIAYDCEDSLLMTTMAKNYGLQKARVEFDYAIEDHYRYAYGVEGVFYTLMVENVYDFMSREDRNPQQIFRFSNSEQLCFDLPCGVPKGEVNAADAAAWLRENADVIALTNEPRKGKISDYLDTILDLNLRACIADYATTIVWLEDFTSLKCFLNEGGSEKYLQGLANFKYLKRVELTGLNADLDVSALGDLEQLEQLTITSYESEYADNIRLNSTEKLGQLSRLRSLTMRYVGLDHLDFLSGMTSLTNFEFMFSTADDYAGLTGAKSLRSLNLLESNLSESAFLEPLLFLNELRLTKTLITEINGLANLQELQWLAADSLDLESVDPLANLTTLEAVNIIDTQVSDISVLLFPLVEYSEMLSRRYRLDLPSSVFCWQQDYALRFNGINDVSIFSYVGACSDADDNNDFDGDGVSNALEVQLGRDPLREDSSTISLALKNMLDLDGDGKADIFVRNTDTFYNYGLASADDSTKRLVFGKNSEDIPLYGDFDGDGKTDIAMRRPSTHMWYVANSSDPGAQGDYIQRVKFGLAAEDIPMVADYDGDGKTDFAVYRPSTKMWYILTSSGEGGDRGDGIMRVRYGLYDGDIPVTGDFDGDGKADIAVRRPFTQTWHILRSSDGQEQVISFGLSEEDIPVPADYDGDGITDLAVRRPSTQMWYILNSSGEPGPYGDGIQRIRFGLDPADIPIVDDYDGDGKADLAVRRASTQMQYILTSSGEGGDRGDGIMRVRFGLQEKYVPFQAPIHIRMQMVEANNQ